MAKLNINIGTADKGDGDPLRIAFEKVNSNFTELYNQLSASVVVGATAPTGPEEGSLWWDSVSGRMYVYYDASWIDASPVDGAGISSTNQLVNGAHQLELIVNGATPYVNFPAVNGGNVIIQGNQIGVAGSGAASRASLTSAESDLMLIANSAVTPKNWTFGTDGSLTLPTGGHIGPSGGKGLGTTYGGANDHLVSLTSYYDSGLYSSCVTAYADGTLNITAYNDGGPNPAKIWTFANDGSLTLPGDILSENAINIDINLSDSTLHRWSFGEDGELTFPQGTTIATADGTDAFIIDGAVDKDIQIYTYSGPTPTAHGWTFGTDGRLTLPGSILFPNALEYTEQGIITSVDTGLGISLSRNLELSAVAAVNSGEGQLYIDTSTNNETSVVDIFWQLNTGTFGVPVLTPVTSVITPTPGVRRISVTGVTFVVGETYTFRRDAIDSVDWLFQSDGALRTSGLGTISHYPGLTSSLKLEVPGGNNIVLRTDGGDWTFGENSSLTFPDSTVQTTAWTGSVNSLVNGVHTATLDNYGHLVLSQGNIEGTTGVGIIANDPDQLDYPTIWAFTNYPDDDGNPTHRKGVIQLPSLQLIESWQNNIRLTNPGLSSITMSSDVVIRAKQQADSDYKAWGFGTDGTLTLPVNSSILTNETALNIATHSTTTYTFDQAYWEALNGDVTRMYTFTGNAQYFSCTVTANQDGTYTVADTTGNSFDLLAGSWFKIPGDELGGATPANDIQITVATVDGGGAILTTNITGTAVGKQWTFGDDGTTTFPTNISIDYSGGNVQFPRIIADSGKAFSVQGQGSTGSAALSWTVDPDAASQYAAVAVTRAGGGNLATVVLQAQSDSGDVGTVKLWRFDETGNLTLPAGGTISEGGGLTGAIRLTPAGGANEYQALVIYPTDGDGDHIHLTAGGGTTDLYLGSDLQYVQIQHSGHVVVQAADGVDNSQWLFNKNGDLTLPAGGDIKDSNGASVLGGGGTTLPTNASGYLVNDGSGNLSWAAGDGTFSGDYDDLTNKPTLFDGAYSSLTGTPALFSGSYTDLTDKPTIPTSFSSLVNGSFTASLDSNGELSLPTNAFTEAVIKELSATALVLFAQSTGGNIKLLAGATSAGSAKQWLFNGTDGKLTAPGNLQVDGGKIILNSAGNAYVESVDYGVNSANSAVNIFGGPYQKIKLRAGFGTEATWTFDTDGDLTAPRNIILNNPVTTVTESVTGTIADSNANPFTFRILKADNPQLVIPFADPNFVLKWTAGDAGSLAAAAQAPGGHGVSSLVSDDGTYWNFNSWYGLGGNRPNTGTVFTVEYGVVVNDTTISTTETNLVIEADAKQWTFGTDGDLTLPAGGDIVDSNNNSVIKIEAPFAIKTAGFDAFAGGRYGVNTTSNTVTATLPASPAAGDAIFFADMGGVYSTNNLTILRNGNSIMGISEDLTMSADGTAFGLCWNGTTWRIY